MFFDKEKKLFDCRNEFNESLIISNLRKQGKYNENFNVLKQDMISLFILVPYFINNIIVFHCSTYNEELVLFYYLYSL